MGPGLYSDIGRRARDLLYRDYHTDQKFSLTTYTATGVAITAVGTKRNEAILGEIQSQLKNKNVTVDVKANSDSSLLTTITVDELATPGLKSILNFVIPDPKSGKIELQYLHDHAGVAAGFGLSKNPIVNVSGVLGTKSLSVGADVGFDTASGSFTKYNAGLSYNSLDFSTSLTVNEKGDQLSASYYHLVNPLFSTAVGAELAHRLSTAENTLTFGTQHALDPLTTVKARVDNYGRASALIQHEWRPKSLITISTEVDTKAIEKGSKNTALHMLSRRRAAHTASASRRTGISVLYSVSEMPAWSSPACFSGDDGALWVVVLEKTTREKACAVACSIKMDEKC